MSSTEAKISLNTDTGFLKLIAAFTMLCDHAGKILFPEIIALQIIGRISFPLFAYCIVVGSLYTGNINKYMLRIGFLALASQFFYIQAFVPGAVELAVYIKYKNVLFTLFTGLAAIHGWKDKKWALFILSIMLAFFGGLDYGIYGVLLMLSFYWFKDNIYTSFIIVAFQLGARFFISTKYVDIFGMSVGLQGFSVLSLPFIYVKTNVNPKINKYFFYLFYPLHLFVLFLLHSLI